MVNIENEAQARQIIDTKLREAGWVFTGTDRNVLVESATISDGTVGRADYMLLNSKGHPLCIIEAKKPEINPLSAKEQARRYAESQNIRLVILSNGEASYLWDIKTGNPQPIFNMPSQKALECRTSFNPDKKAISSEKIIPEYIALTQNPRILEEPAYINENTRTDYLIDNGFRVMRPYQVDAVKAIQKAAANGKDRFLIEMATGLGKTLTSAAIMKLFLRTGNAHRILFLVDRVELENQAFKDLNKYLKNDHIVKIYKQNKKGWYDADIVISTIQSFMTGDRYRDFAPTDFDFVISDEAHRSLGGDSRAVFEYFTGYKLGLTATPKDYLKNVDTDKLKNTDPKALERRILLDTYQTFGCESGEPTYRYSLEDGVKAGYLIAPYVLDIKTGITTQMLSEAGYHAVGKSEDGEEAEAIIGPKDFEKRYFNENINIAMCRAFIEGAEKDPISKEIGKSLVFARSQDHAARITSILNELADQKFPGKYKSDFAVQVTSDVADAQNMTIQFSENNLRGKTEFLDGYKSSKARVCVTVGMMTTGYDCPDLLNIVFMRPVFSPTDFVQMKGRGTRTHTFSYTDENKNEHSIPKQRFILWDFFEICKYFDEKFNYDKELKLPRGEAKASVGGAVAQTATKPIIITENIPDQVISTESRPDGIMRIDKEFWGRAVEEVKQDSDIKSAIDTENWSLAINLFKQRHENKPKLFITIEKIRRLFNLDRRPTRQEILEAIFFDTPIPSLQDKLDKEIQSIITIFQPEPEKYYIVRKFAELYITDNIFRDIIQKGEIQRLNTEYMGIFTMDELAQLGDLQEKLSQYILDNINLNDYMG